MDEPIRIERREGRREQGGEAHFTSSNNDTRAREQAHMNTKKSVPAKAEAAAGRWIIRVTCPTKHIFLKKIIED